MTIKQARKILGVLANDVSDEQIEREIKVAQLLKSIYFDSNASQKLSKGIYNKTGYGKT